MRVTANGGSFTAGKVRLVVYFLEMSAPRRLTNGELSMQPVIETEPITETRGDDWIWPLALLGDNDVPIDLDRLHVRRRGDHMARRRASAHHRQRPAGPRRRPARSPSRSRAPIRSACPTASARASLLPIIDTLGSQIDAAHHSHPGDRAMTDPIRTIRITAQGPARAAGSDGNPLLYGASAPSGPRRQRRHSQGPHGPKGRTWRAGADRSAGAAGLDRKATGATAGYRKAPAGPLAADVTTEDVTGTAYTVVAGDLGKRKRTTNASAVTVTLPNDLSRAFSFCSARPAQGR